MERLAWGMAATQALIHWVIPCLCQRSAAAAVHAASAQPQKPQGFMMSRRLAAQSCTPGPFLSFLVLTCGQGLGLVGGGDVGACADRVVAHHQLPGIGAAHGVRLVVAILVNLPLGDGLWAGRGLQRQDCGSGGVGCWKTCMHACIFRTHCALCTPGNPGGRANAAQSRAHRSPEEKQPLAHLALTQREPGVQAKVVHWLGVGTEQL